MTGGVDISNTIPVMTKRSDRIIQKIREIDHRDGNNTMNSRIIILMMEFQGRLFHRQLEAFKATSFHKWPRILYRSSFQSDWGELFR